MTSENGEREFKIGYVRDNFENDNCGSLNNVVFFLHKIIYLAFMLNLKSMSLSATNR